MAFARVQQFTTSAYGEFTNTKAPASAFGAGNLLEVVCVTADQGVTGFSISAPGLTFTSCGAFTNEGTVFIQVFRAYNLPATQPTVSVTATGATGDSTAQGVQFVGTEYSGLTTSDPFVQVAHGSNVFAAGAAALTGTTAGNLISYSNIDSFDGCTVSTSSSGAVTAGINTAFTALGRGGDYQTAPGGSVTGTHGGPNGYNVIFAVEYALASGGGGGVLAGSTAASASTSGTLSGAGTLAGSAAASASTSGAIAGSGALAGTSAASASTSGSLTGSGALAGAAPDAAASCVGTLTASGLLAGTSTAVADASAGVLTGSGALAGSSAASADAEGYLDALIYGSSAGVATCNGSLVGSGALAGTAPDAAASCSGSLTGAGALVGASSGSADAEGTLVGAGALAGASTAIGSASGALSGLGALAGASAAAATCTGTLGGSGACVGSSAGVWSCTGSLFSGGISGSTSASADAEGTLVGAGALAGTSAASASSSGTLSGTGSLAGSSSASASTSGSLEVLVSGTAAASAAASGALTGVGALAGACAGIAATSGALSASALISGSCAASASTSATLSGLGALTGSADASASASATLTLEGLMSGTSTAVGSSSGTVFASGTLAGAAAALASTQGALYSIGILLGQAAAIASAFGDVKGIVPPVFDAPPTSLPKRPASTNRSALIGLVRAVRAQFVGTDVVVGVVGRRERSKLINQSPVGANRVLFIQPPDGARGTLKRGQQAHTEPRAILQWDRMVTLSVWACDSTALDDEHAQIEAAESLLELTLQAIRRAVHTESLRSFFGSIEFGTVREMVTSKELYNGVEFQVDMSLSSSLFDRQLEITRPKPRLTR